MAAETTDALEMLKDDHREVETLFKEYERLADGDDPAAKEAVAAEICEKLTVHAQVEEEVFYPAARQALDQPELIDEAEEEHADAKQLISELEEMSPEDDAYDATVKSLSDAIAHHVEEEESEMFPKLKEAGMETETVGEQMAERKREILDELGVAETEED